MNREPTAPARQHRQPAEAGQRAHQVAPGAIAEVDLAGLADLPADETGAIAREAPLRLIGLPSGVVADLEDRVVRVLLRKRGAEAEPPG